MNTDRDIFLFLIHNFIHLLIRQYVITHAAVKCLGSEIVGLNLKSVSCGGNVFFKVAEKGRAGSAALELQ